MVIDFFSRLSAIRFIYLSRMFRATLFALILFSFCSTSCKDNEPSEVLETPFDFSASDSVVFEHSGTKPFTVGLTSTAGKLLGAELGPMPGGFSVSSDELEIEANSSRDFSIQFNQNSANPGVYNTTLTTFIYNENSTPKSKQVYLVYRPQCEYEYRNYTYGRITYLINGAVINKNVTCSYTAEGKLLVTDLTYYDVLLDINCQTGAVTMQPLIHLSNYVTGSGSVVNGEIQLQIFDEGDLSANAIIRAF